MTETTHNERGAGDPVGGLEDEFVRECDLKFEHFRCCGDEDLFPFGCTCGLMMVYCYEDHALHADLKNRPHMSAVEVKLAPGLPVFRCPDCGHGFERSFMRNERYLVPLVEWQNAGHGWLLRHDGSIRDRLDVIDERIAYLEQVIATSDVDLGSDHLLRDPHNPERVLRETWQARWRLSGMPQAELE